MVVEDQSYCVMLCGFLNCALTSITSTWESSPEYDFLKRADVCNRGNGSDKEK